MTVNVFACSFFVQWKLPRGPHKQFVLVATAFAGLCKLAFETFVLEGS